MAFVERDGVRLYFEDSGGDGPAVVFLHGGGGNHLSWWQQVPVFAPKFRCITLDQRGSGQSVDLQSGEQGPTQDQLGADVIAVLDHAGVDSAALVCQSMGGWSGVNAALRFPERVWAVVLTNTAGSLVSDESSPFYSRLWEHFRTLAAKIIEDRSRGSAQYHVGLGRAFQDADPARTFLYEQIREMGQAKGVSFGQRLFDVVTPVDDFAALGIPMMFVTGDEDEIIWPEMVAAVHRAVPRSELLRVPAAGHCVYYERPDIFNAEVRRFLAGANRL